MAEATAKKSGLHLEPHQVVLRPLVTEKGTHQSERYNAYAFEVHPQATKEDIKRAVEAAFNVRVVRVRTQTRKGKPRRYKARFSYQRDWKKAIVSLHEEDRISFF
jgi:large subunit ribosomal protein L23